MKLRKSSLGCTWCLLFELQCFNNHLPDGLRFICECMLVQQEVPYQRQIGTGKTNVTTDTLLSVMSSATEAFIFYETGFLYYMSRSIQSIILMVFISKTVLTKDLIWLIIQNIQHYLNVATVHWKYSQTLIHSGPDREYLHLLKIQSVIKQLLSHQKPAAVVEMWTRSCRCDAHKVGPKMFFNHIVTDDYIFIHLRVCGMAKIIKSISFASWIRVVVIFVTHSWCIEIFCDMVNGLNLYSIALHQVQGLQSSLL